MIDFVSFVKYFVNFVINQIMITTETQRTQSIYNYLNLKALFIIIVVIHRYKSAMLDMSSLSLCPLCLCGEPYKNNRKCGNMTTFHPLKKLCNLCDINTKKGTIRPLYKSIKYQPYSFLSAMERSFRC